MRDYLKFCSFYTPAVFWPIIFSLIIESVWAIKGYLQDAGIALCFSAAVFIAMLIGNRKIYKQFKENE